MLVSNHLLTEVQHLVDDAVVINEGRLVATGAIEDLTGSSAQVRTPCLVRLADLLAAAGASIQHARTDTLVVTGLGLDQIGDIAYAAGVAIHELSPPRRFPRGRVLRPHHPNPEGEADDRLPLAT